MTSKSSSGRQKSPSKSADPRGDAPPQPQLSESMMKVSKLGSSSDTRASTRSSKVGRLCSIPVNTPAQLRASGLSSSSQELHNNNFTVYGNKSPPSRRDVTIVTGPAS